MGRRFWFEEVGRLVSGHGVRVSGGSQSFLEPYYEKTIDGREIGNPSYGDGFCARCGTDFQSEGFYCPACTPLVAAEAMAARMLACEACGGPIDPSTNFTYIRHHVTYFPERVAIVHAVCHADIHLHGKYPNLTPPKGDAERFYGWKGKAAKVLSIVEGPADDLPV
jgi:hypothetical protein